MIALCKFDFRFEEMIRFLDFIQTPYLRRKKGGFDRLKIQQQSSWGKKVIQEPNLRLLN
jgi:hypothetical protein